MGGGGVGGEVWVRGGVVKASRSHGDAPIKSPGGDEHGVGPEPASSGRY